MPTTSREAMDWFNLYARGASRGIVAGKRLGPLAAATACATAALVALSLFAALRTSHPATPYLRGPGGAPLSLDTSGLGGRKRHAVWQPTLRSDPAVPAGGEIPSLDDGSATISRPKYSDVDLLDAVVAGPELAGRVAKHGVTPSKYWHWMRSDHLDREWLRWGNSSVEALQRGHPTTPGVPPPGCAVYVNHLYRYIFVRSLFSSNTFFDDILGGECRGELGDKPTCGQVLANEAANMDEERAKRLWQEYTVFTVTSNPWKRAAAVYQFLKANPAKQTGRSSCVQHSWDVFVKDPNVFGRQCQFSGCCRLPDNTAFEHQLVMSDSRCVTNLGHQSALDYIVREDSLATDLPPLIAELNKNAEAGAEEIVLAEVPDDNPHHGAPERERQVGEPHSARQKLAWHWNPAWANMYTRDGSAAFSFVAMYYADDVKFFQYKMPRVQPATEGGAADFPLVTLLDREEAFCSGREGKVFRTSTRAAQLL